MARIHAALGRLFQQNVVGNPPQPPFTSWPPLAEAIGWSDDEAEGSKQNRVNTLMFVVQQEIKMLDWAFAKLNSLLGVGILFFTLGATLKLGSQARIFAAAACVSIVLAVWAISSRFKVMGRVTNSGVEALRVKTLEDKAMYFHDWEWHLKHTRVAIERMFLLVCMLIVITLTIVLVILWPFAAATCGALLVLVAAVLYVTR